MPITASDAVSGSIYVVATSAESAQHLALDYLRTGSGEKVFDLKAEAIEHRRDPFRPHSNDAERVYVVSLDIRVAEEQ